MFDVGGPELLVILLAVVVLFGPKKLPELANMFGKGVSKIRKAQQEFQSQFNNIKSEMDSQVRNIERDIENETELKHDQQFVADKVKEKISGTKTESKAEESNKPD